MKTLQLFLLTLLLAGVSTGSFSQTPVSGGIYTNTTWHASDGPYIVVGDMAVFPNVTLTVEQGTVIKFDSAKIFYIRGTLLLNGTQEEKIIITSNLQNPAKGDWKGFAINNEQGGNIVGSFVQGEYADPFIKILASSSNVPVNLSNSKISNCTYALIGYEYTSDYTIFLDHDSIVFNTHGVGLGQNLTVSNCVFSNGLTGIHNWEYNLNTVIFNTEFHDLTDYPINSWAIIDSCHIHHNAVGIRMKPMLEVHNCIIEYNDVGIRCTYTGEVTPGEGVSNNIIANNTIYNFEHHENYPINMPNNCWGFDNEEEIGLTIYDGYDDVSLGIVTFTPFNTDCVPTGIGNIKAEQDFLYPNPSQDYIRFNTNKLVLYEIYSMSGNLLLKGSAEQMVDISVLNSGIYYMKIMNNLSGYSRNYKFIKQ